MNIEKYIKRAHELHGDKYDYTKFKATKVTEKGAIICPIHGTFYQSMHVHLKGNGHGCPLCAKEKSKKARSLTSEEFIKRSQETHGETYDYSKVNYVNSSTKVCIICPEHGEFWQFPSSHLQGYGCPKCGGVFHYTTQQWVDKANKIHNNRYDYSKVNYVNSKTKVCIICPEHGEFWQTPNDHLLNHGCPMCRQSMLENYMAINLTNNNITFEREKTFEWLIHKDKLYIDFYLPDYNIAIECQGIQHFKPVHAFGGAKAFHECQKRDLVKKELCEKNNVKLFYFSNVNINYPYDVYNDINKLIEDIYK